MDQVTAITRVKPRWRAGEEAATDAAARPAAGRATVRVNGKPAATLSLKAIAELGLVVGQPWDAVLAAQVAETAAYEQALREASRRIDRRALSRAQVRQKLEASGHSAAAIARALERLTELGLVDDAALGRALVEELTARQGAGPELLRARLAQRGLDEALVEQLVEETTQQGDPTAQARALAEKKLAGMRGLPVETQRRRVWGFLARRGFEAGTIEAALRGLVEGGGEEGGEEFGVGSAD